MLWIIALLCLGVVAAIGYYQGPIRVACSLLGLMFGALLAVPLSPIGKKIMPIFGLQHPGWDLFVPALIAFILIVMAFKIVGHVLHRKLSVYYKYKKDDKTYFRWERVYSRLGLCLGLANGAVYFFLLMLPIYVAGYFTTQVAQGAQDPSSVQTINKLRHEMTSMNVDHVLAAYDPMPKKAYQAGDIVGLIRQNPLLESRLAHYPPFLSLAERNEFKDLGNDVQLQQMIQSPQTSVADILKNPKVQALVTNTAIVQEITQLIGSDLDDLTDYLKTGKSSKYDAQPILGIWRIDADATFGRERKKLTTPNAKRITQLRNAIMPQVNGLMLTVTTDNKVILKRENAAADAILGQGTWKKEGDTYQMSMQGNQPDTTEMAVRGEDTLLLPRGGITLVFLKEI
jgi:hypothetical protein